MDGTAVYLIVKKPARFKIIKHTLQQKGKKQNKGAKQQHQKQISRNTSAEKPKA